ncbi:carbon-nitrogen hydrolase family protein [Agrobacterium cavarae]|uniref:carbon-nitrogen hydrolase family protein n=1 Tax=Agrobacterium cavarae TaxID=2528239 RepID=UPI003FCEF0C4
MTQTVRIAAAQTPEFRLDVQAALSYAAGVFCEAEQQKARLLCFPEGYLQGYLLNVDDARAAALDLGSLEFAEALEAFPGSDMTIVMGMIERECDQLFNTAIIVRNRKVIGRYRKARLLRKESFFEAGTEPFVAFADGLSFGVNICCDTAFPEAARHVADLGGQLIVCPANNMLPLTRAVEFKDVHNIARGDRCRENNVWLVSADVTGQRDGNMAWGPTAIIDPSGQVVAQLPLEEAGLLIYDLPLARTQTKGPH